MFKKTPTPPVNPHKEAIAKHIRAADILSRDGRFEDALFEIDRALELDPKNYYAISFKERIRQHLEKTKQTEMQGQQSAQSQLDQRTEKIAHLLKNADQYMQYKQYKLALEEVAKVYVVDPTNYFAQSYSDRIDQLMLQESSSPPAPHPALPKSVAAPPKATQQPDSHEARLEIYRQMLKEMWFDGALNQTEIDELRKVRGTFYITDEEHNGLEKQVHIDSYIEALRIAWRDGVVSDNEEQVLKIMRKKYNISMEEHLGAEAKILWAKSYPHAKGSILIVDDERSILASLSLHLKKHGYDVVTAESVEKAMELIGKNPPALILSDLMFPDGITGLDFYQKVRNDPTLKSTPFILMSGVNDGFIVRGAVRMGVDSFLTKPFNLELLLATIEGRLQSSLSEAT
ncbi:MAG TPA: response regulator [Bacteroidota bacterium]|nr:response regulator [Bacteroidota bacterium]